MHAILATLGTDGDVFPYIGLGRVLRGRGHRVTLATAGNYRAAAADSGLEFAELVSEQENRRVLSNPDFWHPLKGALIAAQWGINSLRAHYELLKELAESDGSVLVASPAILPARLLNEQQGTPLASVILQPWMIASSIAPPIMPAKLTLPRWAPRPVPAIYWRMVDAAGDLLIGRRLNQLRAELGMAPVKRLFQWWNSPELILGMFPDWYGPPQKDWPRQIRLTGFPMFDGGGGQGLSQEVARFCDAGEPPVAFTFGTGMMHANHLFAAVVQACQSLGARGILLTRYGELVPANLPSSILHAEYAPFQELFPRCAAVVHHGGVGTVAKSLAAGTPQLVLPMAFDQLDNATRVKRLGAGDFIRAGRAGSDRIAQALRRLMHAEIRHRCRQLAGRFADQNGLQAAAEQVETLVGLRGIALSPSPLGRGSG